MVDTFLPSNSYKSVRNSYDFVRFSYKSVRNSYKSVRFSYDFVRNSYKSVRFSYFLQYLRKK